ncbi:MAG: hypothetical protein ABJE95_14500 [Byssovorax sp.]
MPANKNKTPAKPVAAARPGAPPKAQAAYELIKPELARLAPESLGKINLDISQAVSISLGVLPGLAFLRPAMARLPDFEIACFDKLETYALGAWYAHLLALPPASATNPVQVLLEEASALRLVLLSDAEALAARGLLDADSVAAIRTGKGNLDTANDLVALSALMGAAWSTIEHKTGATLDEVHRAGDLGPLLIAALGVREDGATATPAEAADRRVRAFTLFSTAYDQVRRGVTYLRWNEGDADSLAPSLYKGRGGSRSAAKGDGAGLGGADGGAPAEPAAGGAGAGAAGEPPKTGGK